jgi:hypothetical protein
MPNQTVIDVSAVMAALLRESSGAANGKSYELRSAPASRQGSGLDVGFVRLKTPPTLESILEDIQASRERR